MACDTSCLLFSLDLLDAAAGITLVLLLGVLVLTGVQPDRRDFDSSAKP